MIGNTPTFLVTARAQFLGSVLLYATLAAVMGRDVLATLSTAVVNDAGDPLLNAAILHWNAHQVPFTDAWWQFPIFYPARDALAFSEHLLGLSVLAAPIDWVAGDPLVAYNLITLLTFPLSGATMYLLVYRLTRSGAGAFIAGLAFGFAPFRMSQLAHIQMLASFWAPLALLGLHAFLDSGRARWLALYGAAWLLQGMANGYALVYFSVLVGFWVLWFVVAPRRWRALGSITLATLIAAVPVVPILATYVTVLGRYGLSRPIEEIHSFGADVAAVLCASPTLTFWGWVRVACRAEGELFPGLGLAVLGAGALLGVLGVWMQAVLPRHRRGVALLRGGLFALGSIYALVIASVLIGGPWKIEWGWFRASAASLHKPLLVMVAAFASAVAMLPPVHAAERRTSTTSFYVLAAIATWLLALGPTITFMGVPGGQGPFAWLLALPGATGLRVPARFWLVTAMCLTVAAGLFAAGVLARRSRLTVALWLALLGTVVTADGWATIRTGPAPPPAPDPRALTGNVVMELPAGQSDGVAPQWRALAGGWKSVNGYSGFMPSHYPVVFIAGRFAEDSLVTPFQRDNELHVIVHKTRPDLVELVRRQPGAVMTAENNWAVQYHLPRRPPPPLSDRIRPLRVAAARSACVPEDVGRALDGDETTRWVCPPGGGPQELWFDLGQPTSVGAFVQAMGENASEAPRHLVVDTSLDDVTWREVWNDSVVGELLTGLLDAPRTPRIVVPFPPHAARYVRVRVEREVPQFHWALSEAELRGPAPTP
jgi:hypothetical protein